MEVKDEQRFVNFFQSNFLSTTFISTSFADDFEVFKNLKGTLRIAGGTAHIPVMQDLAKTIMKRYPDIQISIGGGGSGLGIKQAAEGLVDIGNSGRKITDEEKIKYKLKVYSWATDGIAIIVHPSNPVKNLTKQQLKDIYSGRITNWKFVGGFDRPITLYTRPDDSGTREVFWSNGLDKGEISKRANIVPSNGAMKVAVSKDPNGIGYISIGYIDNSVKVLSFEGIQPTVENVLHKKYAISRELYSVTKENSSELAEAFIKLLYTETGKRMIREHGLIPVK